MLTSAYFSFCEVRFVLLRATHYSTDLDADQSTLGLNLQSSKLRNHFFDILLEVLQRNSICRSLPKPQWLSSDSVIVYIALIPLHRTHRPLLIYNMLSRHVISFDAFILAIYIISC